MVVVVWMVREPHRVSTAGDPVKCRKRWGRMIWGGDRDMVIEVEGVWNLGRMEMLSCIRAGIGMLVCVLVLVVVVVLAVGLV